DLLRPLRVEECGGFLRRHLARAARARLRGGRPILLRFLPLLVLALLRRLLFRGVVPILPARPLRGVGLVLVLTGLRGLRLVSRLLIPLLLPILLPGSWFLLSILPLLLILSLLLLGPLLLLVVLLLLLLLLELLAQRRDLSFHQLVVPLGVGVVRVGPEGTSVGKKGLRPQLERLLTVRRRDAPRPPA